MTTRFVSRTSLSRLLDSLRQEYAVLVPVEKGGTRYFHRLPPPQDRQDDSENGTQHWPDFAIGGVRAVEPLKAFFFCAKQRVAVNFDDTVPEESAKPLCLVGAKACDLAGFKILDSVFLDSELAEPFYTAARGNNLIIAGDCTTALDVCFCLAVGGKPFPEEGFDLLLSEIDAGFLVEVGSGRGGELLDRFAAQLREATAEEIDERERIRRDVTARVEENIRVHEIPAQAELSGAVRSSYDSSLWKEEAEECVECGACNTICPTCHCFLLFDRLADRESIRFRVWDSCLIKDFARVAGGANPRPELWMRLRNRFEKKFDFFPNLIGRYACTGCGRCILACPAKIDIRRVLHRSVEHVR